MSSSPDAPADSIELSICVPCLNEGPRIGETLENVRAAVLHAGCTCEVLVIDDASTDDTSEKVVQFAARHPEMRIRLYRNPSNLGLAHSYVDAAFWARGEYFLLVWGDNAFSRQTIDDILSHLGDYDLVVPYVSCVQGKPLLRRAFSKSYTRLVNLLSGHRLRYYNGGLLCRRFHVLRWAPRCVGFSGFLAELITQILDLGASYVEIPFESRHTVKSQQDSVLTLRNFASTGHTLLRILLRRIRRQAFGPLGDGVVSHAPASVLQMASDPSPRGEMKTDDQAHHESRERAA